MAYLARVSGDAGHLGDAVESHHAPDSVHQAAEDMGSGCSHSGLVITLAEAH